MRVLLLLSTLLLTWFFIYAITALQALSLLLK